jgi:hypothetical protein
MGITFCDFCPVIFDCVHLKECEGNRQKKTEMEKLRKKRIYQAEARAKCEAEPGELVEVRDKRALGKVQLR